MAGMGVTPLTAATPRKRAPRKPAKPTPATPDEVDDVAGVTEESPLSRGDREWLERHERLASEPVTVEVMAVPP